jgi:formate-dependent phosphoribosylglycinamide formyltransferase (GAR transformylase)
MLPFPLAKGIGMNVLMVSPGFPGEMPSFARGLARVGARVFGLGDQPAPALPEKARRALAAHLHVENLWDEAAVVQQVLEELRHVRIDRVECLWEPAVYLAGRLREALGVPGLTREQTVPFRDKERMKQVLDAAGIRTPWHRRARTKIECRAAAEDAGFPVIVKPIAGAGSTDTYRADSREELERVLSRLGHVEEVSVEEFVEGQEFTFDTICADGEILYENVAVYRWRPLEEKKHQWISPSSICLRDIDAAELAGGRQMGRAVLRALGFRTGFTHMEWYRKADGEVVFGEIGARPPGGHLVDAMNHACEADLFAGWAEAVCLGRFSQRVRRSYNAGVVSKRAQGAGRVRSVEGLHVLSELGPALAAAHINPIGSPVGDWKRAAVSDGWVIVRHPDFGRTLELVDRVARELQIYAG